MNTDPNTQALFAAAKILSSQAPRYDEFTRSEGFNRKKKSKHRKSQEKSVIARRAKKKFAKQWKKKK